MPEPGPDPARPTGGLRVWMVNHYAGAPDHPAGTRHYDLARQLIARGHEVTIFATGFSNVTHRDERLGRWGLYRTRTYRGVRFVWVRTFPYHASDWRRQANMLTFVVTFLVAQTRFSRPQVVIGSTVHPFAAFAAWFAARARRARFLFEVRDLWPQTLVDLGALREGSPGERLLRALEAFLVRRASAVITLLPGMRDYLVGRGLPADHVVYVPNGVDLATFDTPPVDGGLPQAVQDVRAAADRLRAEGRLVVGYVGAFGRVNRLDTVLLAAAMAEQRAPGRVGLVIVGDGPERAELAHVAAGQVGAVVCGPVPKAFVAPTLRAFDAAVVHTTETPVYRYGISFNKLFEYMGAARPVVFACTSAYDPVAHEGAGVTVRPDDPSALADAFIQLADAGTDRRAAMGSAGRSYVEREHAMVRLGATLAAVVAGERDVAPATAAVALDDRTIGAPAPVAPRRRTLPRQALGFVAGHPAVRRTVISTPVVRDIAWRFVAGETLADGIAALRALNDRGLGGSLNHVGTHVRHEADAVAAADAAIESLRRIAEARVDAHLSLKLTQVGLDVDEALGRAQLARVLGAAREADVFVRIDMEESRYVPTTLSLFEEARDEHGAERVGIAVQSYLRHRTADLGRLVDGGSRVRLVKGGYWESPEIVHRAASEVDAAFLRDIELLLRRGTQPAIATHDSHAVNHARRVAADLGLDRQAYEFQMLYGVRPDLQDRLVRDGHRVRCYVPYGGQWYEYVLGCIRRVPGGAVRRVRERATGRPA